MELIIQLVINEVRKKKMSESFRNTKGEADKEDAAASDLQEKEVLRDTATVSMMEEIGNYSFPSSTVISSSNLNASVLQTHKLHDTCSSCILIIVCATHRTGCP